MYTYLLLSLLVSHNQWRIPGMEEPGGLLFMGSHRVGHDWSDLAAAEHVEQWLYKAALIAMVSNSSASFKGIAFSDLLLISKNKDIF